MRGRVRIRVPSGWRCPRHSLEEQQRPVRFKQKAYQGRTFSASTSQSAYSDTVPNLKIGAETRVIFQGFTGRQATQNAKQSLEYGTKIVGGVTPGRTGEHLGLPILPSVRAAKEQLKPDATAVYVAAGQAATAIEEAIEAEIPLVVAVAEHIPLHDMLRVQFMLRSQSKSRLVGANSPGMISAVGRCRLGFHPLSAFQAGCVGIIAKSGTLSYETVASTTRAGVGQSLVIGMGGDPLPGTDFVDALRVFELDEDTKGIILVGEIGGRAEDEAAEWIKEYRARSTTPKPIMALIGGIEAPPAKVMGHAGAYVSAGERNAKRKVRALEDAGVVMTSHPSRFGETMKRLLTSSGISRKSSPPFQGQKRQMHTGRRPAIQSPEVQMSVLKRKMHISEANALDMLKQKGVAAVQHEDPEARDYFLTVTFDRTLYKPCIIASYSIGGESAHLHAKSFPLEYGKKEAYKSDTEEIMSILFLKPPTGENRQRSLDSLSAILSSLMEIFYEKEASSLHTRIACDMHGDFGAVRADFEFDDGALRSKRHGGMLAMRDTGRDVPEEAEAEEGGIVYMKLKGSGTIGTLVNGAGLAMNTIDAITALGGQPANFLDTGGKATKDTVKSCFRIILKDARVNTVFVNIFGGLTLCDMIAEGIMLAYKDLDITIPVVVRLRGTNEGLGQKMITESGWKLHAFDDFDEAAVKVIELSNGGK